MVDWDKPLEAINLETGETVDVEALEPCNDGTDDIAVLDCPGDFQVFKPNGSAWIGEEGKYRIRNVGDA